MQVRRRSRRTRNVPEGRQHNVVWLLSEKERLQRSNHAHAQGQNAKPVFLGRSPGDESFCVERAIASRLVGGEGVDDSRAEKKILKNFSIGPES